MRHGTAPLPASSSHSIRESLAGLATREAGASRVFARYRLDYCCHGGESLEDACARRGLDPQAMLAEIAAEAPRDERFERFDDRPLPEVIDHILARYHAGHREELPRLHAMAEKVEAVHRDKPDCPRGLAAHLELLSKELEEHMQKEEQVLFPMLRAGRGSLASGPIQVLELEHEDHARNLERSRELAHDFVPPADACGTWRALYLGLDEFEREVMRHVHLENHVLFPRALNG
jgi:regulator of cell morphogenesis and NO signaling